MVDTQEMKRQLADLEERHKQLLEVEERLKEVRHLFQEIAVLIEMQVEVYSKKTLPSVIRFIRLWFYNICPT